MKVLDFGLAKALDPTATSDARRDAIADDHDAGAMTGVGMILGTAAYMAPEQAQGPSRRQTRRHLGVRLVLYEMLTGRRAFDGDDVAETLVFVLTREPDWNGLPAGTPTPVRRVLRRCLQQRSKRTAR